MGVRIQELPETTGINKEDVLIVEDGQGTKKGTVQQLDEALGVSQLKEDLTGSEIGYSINLSTANNGFIDKNGNIITQYDGYLYTNPINIKKDYTVIFKAQGYNTNVAMISKFENGTITPLVVSTDSTYREYTYQAEEDMQIILSCAKGYGEKSSVILEVKQQLELLNENKLDKWHKQSVSWVNGWCEPNGTPHIGQGSYYKMTDVVAIDPKKVNRIKLTHPYKGASVAYITFFNERPPHLSNVSIAYSNNTANSVVVEVPNDALYYIVSKSPSDSTEVYYEYSFKRAINFIYKKYRYANVNIVGDSYSTFDGYIQNGNWTWYPSSGNQSPNDVSELSDTWFYKLAKELNCKILCNDSSSGTTVSTSTRTPDIEWSAMVNRVVSTMGEAKAKLSDAKPDLIIVFGGRNDYTLGVTVGENKYSGWTDADKKEFAPAFCLLLDYLIKYNPYSEVVAISGSHLSEDYNNAISLACNHYGIKNIVLPEFELQSGHPSKSGMTTIAQTIIDNLLE